jgi:hypothetical protein
VKLTPMQIIGIILVVNGALIGATAQLTDAFGAQAVKFIVLFASLGNSIFGGIITMLSGQGSMVRSVLAMPGIENIDVNGQASSALATLAVDPEQKKIGPTEAAMATVTATAKAAASVLFAFIVLSMFMASGPAQAQGLRKPQITGDFGADAKVNLGIGTAVPANATTTPSGTKLGDSGCKATGDPIGDLHCVIKAGGAKLILHLKQSYALASAPGSAAGSLTDNTSATCTKALVPIFDLVINGPKAGTIAAGDPMALTPDEVTLAANPSEIDGPIVIIEKIRILRLAIQSPALNDACGALVQDEVKNAQSLVGKVTSLVTGAGILAPLGL